MSLVKEEKKKTGGLAGIVAGDSAICLCSAEDQNLLYRGYAIADLCAHSNFEEVAWLLLRGELPNKAQLDTYRHALEGVYDLPQTLKKMLENLPKNSNMM